MASEKDIGPINFKPIMKLGQGSFGEVYLVQKVKEDMKAGEEPQYFALKILNKDKVLQNNLVRYAKTERDVLTYTKHPYVVGLNYAFQSAHKLFLLLDYASGGNMERALQREHRFSEERARLFIAQIILALEELHKRDIIYRDLKPANIVFDHEGNALLTDFGLSKEGVDKNASGGKSFCGSPAYLPPEMLSRKGHGKSIDWYLTGVLLYEMLIGIPPYYANNKDQLYENIKSGPLKLPNFISADSRDLII